MVNNKSELQSVYSLADGSYSVFKYIALDLAMHLLIGLVPLHIAKLAKLPAPIRCNTIWQSNISESGFGAEAK